MPLPNQPGASHNQEARQTLTIIERGNRSKTALQHVLQMARGHPVPDSQQTNTTVALHRRGQRLQVLKHGQTGFAVGFAIEVCYKNEQKSTPNGTVRHTLKRGFQRTLLHRLQIAEENAITTRVEHNLSKPVRKRRQTVQT